MFSTIKSRVIAISAIVLFLSVISSIFIGAFIAKNYINNSIYPDGSIIYRVDTGQELETIANGDYFNQERLVSQMNSDQQFTKQANRVLITSIVIVSLVLIAIFAFFINLGYDKFVKTTINLDNEKVDDFKDVKQIVNTQNELIAGTNNDIEKINSYISHELKNSLALLRTKDGDADAVDQFIEDMNNQLDDINALTTNTLTNQIEFDLLLVVANVVDQYSSHDINLDFEDGNFNMLGNGTLMSRAIDNIINNAYKYGAKSVIINLENLNDSIVLKISNDGDEISNCERDKIFDFKYRTPELKANGSGIGLALVKNIVELHHGGLYVESNSDQTTFYLAFKQC